MLNLSLIDVQARRALPSILEVDRTCVALPYHTTYAVRIGGLTRVGPGRRLEIVTSVDGRNVVDNTDARPDGQGYVVDADVFTCTGFRISHSQVREFLFVPEGDGSVAERNNTAGAHGLIAFVIYSERVRPTTFELKSYGVTRGGERGTRSSGGTAAGQQVTSQVRETSFARGPELLRGLIEYDTHESWLSRGIRFPLLGAGNPWPGNPGFSTNLG